MDAEAGPLDDIDPVLPLPIFSVSFLGLSGFSILPVCCMSAVFWVRVITGDRAAACCWSHGREIGRLLVGVVKSLARVMRSQTLRVSVADDHGRRKMVSSGSGNFEGNAMEAVGSR